MAPNKIEGCEGAEQMNRRDEIIKLQMDVIHQMTQSNLKRLSDDLWGVPALENTPENASNEVTSGKPEKRTTETTGTKPEEKTEKDTSEAPVPEDMASLQKELSEYIGLNAVKQEVESLINLVTVQKLRKQNDLPTEDLSLHMVFSGNPGTGKTMIARLMSRIYLSLGILSKGHLVEVDRSGLVAGYVGQTAIKTSEVIQKAMGGVLFIDEAYALTSRGSSDYGQEAVDTLLKAMEDHREDLIVIVAGYTELMEEFVHSNPGLESRFNRFLHFPDYTVQEMMDIFDMRCQKSGYFLEEEAKGLLRELLTLSKIDVKGFGNARGVRNLFEKTVSMQANRLAQLETVTREELMRLSLADLRAASGESDEEKSENKYEEKDQDSECAAVCESGIKA